MISEITTGGDVAVSIDADTRSLDLELPDEEIASRLAAWRLPELPFGFGVFSRYRALVGSASEGAVLRNG